MEVILKLQGPVLVNMSVGALVGFLQGSLQRHEQVLAELEVRRIQREQEIELRAEQMPSTKPRYVPIKNDNGLSRKNANCY
jgi:heme exporter protein D